MVVTNHAEDIVGNIIPGTLAEPTSYARADAVRRVLGAKGNKSADQVVMECIQDPEVNVMDTIAAVTFNTATDKARYASDTYFAAAHLQA